MTVRCSTIRVSRALFCSLHVKNWLTRVAVRLHLSPCRDVKSWLTWKKSTDEPFAGATANGGTPGERCGNRTEDQGLTPGSSAEREVPTIGDTPELSLSHGGPGSGETRDHEPSFARARRGQRPRRQAAPHGAKAQGENSVMMRKIFGGAMAFSVVGAVLLGGVLAWQASDSVSSSCEEPK